MWLVFDYVSVRAGVGLVAQKYWGGREMIREIRKKRK